MKRKSSSAPVNFHPTRASKQINPGLWGKRLAEYFVRKLSEKGIKTEEIIAEDWGWYIPVQNEDLARYLLWRPGRRR